MIEERISNLANALRGKTLAELEQIARDAGLSRKTLERFRANRPIHLHAVIRLEQTMTGKAA